VPEPLPVHRLRARNTAPASENRIHDDDVAQKYGFRGGLVPGVTVYAYLTRPLVAVLGAAWLDRGTGSVRFARPVLDGEEVTLSGEITERTKQGVTAVVRASTEAAGECAVLNATLPAGLPTPVNLAVYREAALPEERPEATAEHLRALDVLGTPVTPYDEARAAEYLESVGDDLPLYRGARGRIHPAFYLDQANRSLDRNIRMGPWIHVGSVVRHLGAAHVGQTLRTRGRVRSLFEKRGREFVEVDLALLADGRPIAHVLHTAIYRLPAPV
jgi:acyl dehydratase